MVSNGLEVLEHLREKYCEKCKAAAETGGKGLGCGV